MRIFITSTPEELEPYQVAACDVAAELGHQPLLRDPTRGRGLKPVSACARQVASADAVLAIVGHRLGRVPTPGLGGDGFHPWTWWETRAAFERGLPVAVLMASEAWPSEVREDDAGARSLMRDFRGELARLATSFDEGPGPGFRRLVRRQLVAMARESAAGSEMDAGPCPSGGTRLRRWPAPELPPRPYPVLLPYSHPDLLAGRDRELDKVRELLAQPVPILGLHAPSGTGKSSFLRAGLVERLRAEGRPVAFDRYPREPGIVRRLLGDLLEGDEAEVADDDPLAFVERLRDVLHLVERPAVLVLDQFEDLLRFQDAVEARAVLGTLLAASAQRQPGLPGPPCRWLLAYRQEFHGEVFQWLGDALREARAASSVAVALPHDLAGSERFHAWPLLPLGTPAPGTEDRVGAAARVFQEAIEKPLTLRSAEGVPVYPWRFADHGAARLARAFGEARAARPDAPLVPELQVVLAHLLDRSPAAGGVASVEVPEEPGPLIDQALEEHLRRSLDLAFPAGRTSPTDPFDPPEGDRAPTKLRRTRALLALRELADGQGRRDQGRPATALARAIGRDGREVLESLATPQTRLVLLERHGDEQVFVLSHDRMAEVIVRLVDDEGAYAGLGVDAGLLGLRRFVTLQRELFTSGEVEQSTEVPKGRFSAIERHADALLWDDEGRRWWDACRQRRRLDRRRKVIRRGTATAVFVVLTLLAGTWTHRTFQRRALLKTIAEGEPETAFAALGRLSAESDDHDELLARVRERKTPFDLLERGLGGVGEDRGPALLRAVELLLPLVTEAPEDPVRIASTVWALDFFALPDPALRQPAIRLRDEVLEPLRRRRPPPPLPDSGREATPGDPKWADIPAGTFWMGLGPNDARDEDAVDEEPRHRVTISAFRIMTREVTRAEVRLLWPDHAGEPTAAGSEDEGELPAALMTWYEAYTYAAWRGGRLPTEAEWEYAARAGCEATYCKRDGSVATLGEVAWWPGNSVGPGTEEPAPQPVGRLEPNPWGLYDVYGNVFEWTADWLGPYSSRPEVDPPGPTSPPAAGTARILRGGSAVTSIESTVAFRRVAYVPEGRVSYIGLRVALPAY